MNLQELAKQYGLRSPRQDLCGDLNLIGKRGEIYEYGDGLFAVTILTKLKTAYHWNHYHAGAIANGLKIMQNGDKEGTFLFHPEIEHEAKFAIEAARIGKKRQVSEAVRQRFVQMLDRKREVIAGNDNADDGRS